MRHDEFLCPDGYVSTKVPLRSIKFRDLNGLKERIGLRGKDETVFARYAEQIQNGAYANGVPVVYRNPEGTLLASDIRHSDIALYAERTVKVHAGHVPRDGINPLISVRIIEITDLGDIIGQRAKWRETHPMSQREEKIYEMMKRLDARAKPPVKTWPLRGEKFRPGVDNPEEHIETVVYVFPTKEDAAKAKLRLKRGSIVNPHDDLSVALHLASSRLAMPMVLLEMVRSLEEGKS